jgi:PGAP1-like protein
MRYFLSLLVFSFSTVLLAQVRFQSKPDPAFYPERSVVTPIVANIAYQGYEETQAYFGEGEYEVFLDLVDGVLDQPIILLDGFDPGDSRDIGGLYASLTFEGQNMADILRAEGYDIVILNAPQYTTDGKDIDGGADYIQRNAMVLAALIEEINAQKVGDAELVIIGPSMGGLIARYGLAYMEANSIPHETRLYISFDSPHRGANIPISLQYLINYFAQEVGDATAQAIVDGVLNSPAAKEMLVDHLLAHLLAGSNFEQDPTKLLPEGAPNFRDAFQAELDDLGFPQQVRNVTMINGSGNGTTNGAPGAEIVNTNLTIDALTDVDVALYFTPAASQTNTVTDVTVYFIGIPVATFSTEAESPSTTDGVDSSPGGTSSIADALGDGGGNPVLIEFINALQQEIYSFIPTMSSLAIDTDNWYGSPNLANSPFVNFYIPNENEPHVTVTAPSAQFALDEIRQNLGVTDYEMTSSYVLSKNPVDSNIYLSVNAQTQADRLVTTVFNLSGQKVMEKQWLQPTGELIWHQNLASGFYILQLNDGSTIQSIKMLVK